MKLKNSNLDETQKRIMLLTLEPQIGTKGLLTPRDYGFFSSENNVIEEILKLFFSQYLLF